MRQRSQIIRALIHTLPAAVCPPAVHRHHSIHLIYTGRHAYTTALIVKVYPERYIIFRTNWISRFPRSCAVLSVSRDMLYSHKGYIPIQETGAHTLMFPRVKDKGALRLEDLAGATTCRQYFKPSI